MLNRKNMLPLSAVMLLALGCRIVFFTGTFGSDEVVYTKIATAILHGDWTVSDYIGATRYGANIPMAIFMWLFGQNEVAANLWSLICSLAEIWLIMHLGLAIWGQRAAIFAGLILASLPLHVHFAGRLMADAPLAFFITLSIYLFFWAEHRQKIWLYIAAGLSVGMVSWMKEVVLAFSLIFAIFPIIWHRFDAKWLLVVGFAILPVLANLLLFKIISGNAFHILDVMSQAHDRVSGGIKSRGIGFYPYYLFLDLRHTALLGYLAVAALFLTWRSNRTAKSPAGEQAASFVWIWALGLIFVFTFFVFSFSPLKLVSKQTNYMLIFIPPLCLLAGYFLAHYKHWVAHFALAVTVLGGIFLSGLEQQAIRNFTANSKATVALAIENPNSRYFVATNALTVASYLKSFQDGAQKAHLEPLQAAQCGGTQAQGGDFVIIDHETLDWGENSSDLSELKKRLKGCWQEEGILTPIGFGIGKSFIHFAVALVSAVPLPISDRIAAYVSSYANPKKAVIYRLKG